MLHPSTIQLLRFHFSFFLLPVYLFALSQSTVIDWQKAAFVFLILHVLVYPSSNGYNSYMDRDETPIGGLASPLQPTKQLFYVTIAMDLLAVVLSFFIDAVLAYGVIVYILASRAYSYRGIRLKRFPMLGFLTVFLFQGALIFFITYETVNQADHLLPMLEMLLASLLIGALYPLTQIYQHKEDIADGVKTISYLLGKRGTFIFSMFLFLSATTLFYFLFQEQNNSNHFLLLLLFFLPVVLFFLCWMRRVWLNEESADFKHSLRMNILATFCTTAFFITLIILNH